MERSRIVAIHNLTTGKWEVRKDMKPVRELTISIGFVREGMNEINFNKLSFGIKITNKESGDLLLKRRYPIGKKEYKTNGGNQILENYDFMVDVFDDYVFEFTSSESSIDTLHREDVTVPMPQQPYPSWMWNGMEWFAPIPLPDNYYADDRVQDGVEWDEAGKRWILQVDEVNPLLALDREDRVNDGSDTVEVPKY